MIFFFSFIGKYFFHFFDRSFSTDKSHYENLIFRRGGRRIYIETSSRPQYEATRAFYRAQGYREEACLEDFYAPGDGKIIYTKSL